MPMSGWARISTQAKPVTRISGPMMRRSVASSSRRRAMKSAAKRVSASFMSSEGCRRNCPKPTHRLDPMACTPRPGTSTTKRSPKVREQQQGAEAAQAPVVDPQRHTERHGADGHPHDLADEDGPGCAVGGDGDDRRGRPDHDQADEAEQRTSTSSSVEIDTCRPPRRTPAGAVAFFGDVRAGRRPSFTVVAGVMAATLPRTRARPPARSDTRCTAPVSRTARPKWRRVGPRWWRVM